MNDKTAAVIVAGGTGSRMNSTVPKQFIDLCGEEIIYHTVMTFLKCEVIDKIIIVCHKDFIEHCKKMFSSYEKVAFALGGNTRQESVYNGLKAISNFKYVLVHDAVRCLVTSDEIKKLFQTLVENGSCTLAVKVKDTVKVADENNVVTMTVPRDNLWQVHTPQAFVTKELLSAHEFAVQTNFIGTDDCSVMENADKPIILVEGSYENIKITTPSDLKIAKVILEGRR